MYVCDLNKALTRIYSSNESPPVREGVLGQVQVGEVRAATSKQGPKQLAGERRDKQGRVKLTAVNVIVLCNSYFGS